MIAHIRKQYRLDRPLPVQYLYWVKGVLTGDLGESMRIKQPVADLILAKLPVTLQLASMAFLFALAIGIPAGIVSAVKKDTAWDWGANLFALWAFDAELLARHPDDLPVFGDMAGCPSASQPERDLAQIDRE